MQAKRNGQQKCDGCHQTGLRLSQGGCLACWKSLATTLDETAIHALTLEESADIAEQVADACRHIHWLTAIASIKLVN